MFRKLIFTSIAILILAAGCIPVGEFQVGVESTPTERPIVIEPEPTDTPDVVVEPSAELTDAAAAEFGEVSGAVCFPSEFLPAMTLYFRDTSDGMLYAAVNAENVSTYSHELPVGNYIAFAYPNLDTNLGGLYSVALPCGLGVECIDHSPLPFDIQAGQATTGIDICDWYAEPNAVPQNPNAAFETDHSLAGLVYQDLNLGGIWMVDEAGLARPLLDKWTAVISEDGRLALFEESDDIFLADLAMGTWRNLTNTPDRWESNPQFVPQFEAGAIGKVLFFSGSMDEERMSGAMTQVSFDGSGYTILDERLTSIPPTFSPDGSQMAFSLGDSAWIYNASWDAPEQFDPATFGLDGVRAIVSPSWSPDGSKLAWWVVVGEGTNSYTSLAIFDLANRTNTLMHSYQPIGGGFNLTPVWSPDSQWLAVTVLSEFSKASLWVISLDGQEIDLGDAAYPVWSPDGKALLVIQWPSNGGPAWESTALVYVTGEWTPNVLNLKPGDIPLAFIEQ